MLTFLTIMTIYISGEPTFEAPFQSMELCGEALVRFKGTEFEAKCVETTSIISSPSPQARP